MVLKSDKLHGRKPKEIESRTGSDNSSSSSSTAIKSLHGKNSAVSAPFTAVAPTDYERIEKIVSERVAAELSTKLLPLTLAMNMMQKELQSAKETMEKMSSIISKLSNSSFADTTATTESAQQQDREPGRSESTETDIRKPTYAAAAATGRGVAQSPQHYRSQQNTVRSSRKQYEPQQRATQEAVTAMYVDQKRKQQRANNIIISGLQASENDVMTVTELLRSEFEWDAAEWPGISVSKCRRLGKPQDNKNQLLLVTLDSCDQANYYIKNARILRRSNEKAIRENVYINADLTPPEARAAYELRTQRRQRREHQDIVIRAPQQSTSRRTSRLIWRSHDGTSTVAADPVFAHSTERTGDSKSSSAETVVTNNQNEPTATPEPAAAVLTSSPSATSLSTDESSFQSSSSPPSQPPADGRPSTSSSLLN